MNKSIFTGRFVKDPEVKVTKGDLSVCSFNLAVERKFKTASGEKQTDFIPCVARRKVAEIIGNNIHKGSKVLIIGNIQTRTYDDKDKKKVYITEVIVDEIEFLDKGEFRGEGKLEKAPNDNKAPEGFYPVTDDDTSLPFDL